MCDSFDVFFHFWLIAQGSPPQVSAPAPTFAQPKASQPVIDLMGDFNAPVSTSSASSTSNGFGDFGGFSSTPAHTATPQCKWRKKEKIVLFVIFTRIADTFNPSSLYH